MILRVDTIKPSAGSKRKSKKIGRGNASGHGTSATRGGKGQTARSGGSRGLKMKGFRLLMQSTPKLRGFTSQKIKPAEVYLSDLNKKYQEGETVDLNSLREKKLISPNDRSAKILDRGEIKKKLTFTGIKFTKGAGEKIQAAGGSIA